MSDKAKLFFDIAQVLVVAVVAVGVYGAIGISIANTRRYRRREEFTQLIAIFWPVAVPLDFIIHGYLRLFRWARKRTRYLSWCRDAEDNLYW
ncbi:MAG: hypothetical protein L0Y56_06065 [Nitrospira sp.]|nr:hypothetical protein [Nitrospira sp.]